MRPPPLEGSRNAVMSDLQQFDSLLHKYLEGETDATEVKELERLLLSDDSLVERASEQSLLHRQVFELLTEQRLHEIMDTFAGSGRAVPQSLRTAASDSQTPAKSTRSAHVWQLVGLVSLAASALLALALWQRPPSDLPIETEVADSTDNETIAATLTQLASAEWQPGAQQYQYGAPLPSGSRIKLAAGMAKVTFECGAEVMLEGPCDFLIRDEMVGILSKGKIAANVPRRAFAFAILSPGVDFVDLGTSFGISVDDSGKSELHVFEGEVLYSPNDPGQRASIGSVHVTANKAVGFASDGASTDIALSEKSFSRLLSLRKAVPKYDAPLSGAQLALWLTADAGVSTDDGEHVLSWQDIVSDDNRTAEDAIQPDDQARPTWVPNAIDGHAAVRFDGNSDFLVTTPLETTDDQTVFLVCQFSEGAFKPGRQWGGQILNYDGPPSREASNTFAPGILQIGEPLLEADFQPTLITGQVFAGFIGSATVESGRVDGKSIGANEPAIIAYNYDYTNGKATLALNGRVLGESRAFAPQALASRKIIGRHAWKELFFSGDLGEVLIYNKALSTTELGEVTSYLAEKYGIEVGESTH
jgi:hypothetical protein